MSLKGSLHFKREKGIIFFTKEKRKIFAVPHLRCDPMYHFHFTFLEKTWLRGELAESNKQV